MQKYVKNFKKPNFIDLKIHFIHYFFKSKTKKIMSEKTNEKKYTLELESTLSYMRDTLINEFPTNVFTLEYLILSILDNKNSHANVLLEKLLTSKNMEELKKIYVSVIEKYSKPRINGKKIPLNDDITRALDTASLEAQKTNSNEIGTEHILLAILNKEYNFKEEGVFGKFGVGYSFILSKCNTKSKKTTKTKTKKMPNEIPQIPLKSQINTKVSSLSFNSEYIEQFTVSLNEMAKNGKIDDLIGREKEIREIIEILSRRKKNNAVLVGNGGCGKTAIVQHIAKMIESGNVPTILEGKEIVMLNQTALVGGTHFRGMFEERVNGLFKELQSSNKYILFIDDMHTAIKGNKDKEGDISGMIGEILTDGTVKVIGATTFKEYRSTIEPNTQIARKLQKIIIEPTTVSDTIEILEHNKKYYEQYHNVEYGTEAIKKAVELADRYITDRSLPDSAFDVIDLAGARTSLIDREPIEIQTTKRRLREIEKEKNRALNAGDFEEIDSLSIEENVLNSDMAEYKRNVKNLNVEAIEITENDISEVVSEITNIPVSKLSIDEKKKIAHIDETLKNVVVGQDEAIDEICKVIKRNRIGLNDKTHTNGVFLLGGPTGSGKSLLAKTIAKEIYGDENALIRIDMSEYSEKNSVSKLYGSSPGYIGYDDGGVLTNAIKRKPYSVVLLDEIEKADESIYNLFLQVFDEGRLTESNGNLVDCHNCIFIMTSNIGAKKVSELSVGVGFTTNEESNKKSIIEKELKRKFTPEFLNRINKIVYFNNLNNNNLRDIVILELNKLNNKLNNNKYNIIYSDDVVDYIHVRAVKEKEFGARPIIRLIQDTIEDKLTDLMLENDYEKNYTFSASCENDEVIIT